MEYADAGGWLFMCEDPDSDDPLEMCITAGVYWGDCIVLDGPRYWYICALLDIPGTPLDEAMRAFHLLLIERILLLHKERICLLKAAGLEVPAA